MALRSAQADVQTLGARNAVAAYVSTGMALQAPARLGRLRLRMGLSAQAARSRPQEARERIYWRVIFGR